MKDEWGPWIEHDGKGCPCVGMVVEAYKRWVGLQGPFVAGQEAIKFLGSADVPGSAWVYVHVVGVTDDWILRYRIRRPRGMEVLDAILADLPEKVTA